jgi:hypothetical protein
VKGSRASFEERPIGRVLFGVLWLNGMRFWGLLLVLSIVLLIFGDTLARVIGVGMLLASFIGVAGMFRRH